MPIGDILSELVSVGKAIYEKAQQVLFGSRKKWARLSYVANLAMSPLGTVKTVVRRAAVKK